MTYCKDINVAFGSKEIWHTVRISTWLLGVDNKTRQFTIPAATAIFSFIVMIYNQISFSNTWSHVYWMSTPNVCVIHIYDTATYTFHIFVVMSLSCNCVIVINRALTYSIKFSMVNGRSVFKSMGYWKARL